MSFVKKAFLAVIAAGALSSAAQAAVFQINPVISGKFSTVDGTVLQGGVGGSAITPTGAGLYSVDLYLKYTPSTGQPAFGNFAYNIVPDNTHVTRLTTNVGTAANLRNRNYVAVATRFDSDADGTTDTNYFGFNSDAGNDFNAVLLGVDTTIDSSGFAADDRKTAGQAGNPQTNAALGIPFGRVYVNYDGALVPSTVSFNIVPFGQGNDASTWNPPPGNNSLSSATGSQLVNGTALFVVPEPTSLAFLACGGLLAFRRRTA